MTAINRVELSSLCWWGVVHFVLEEDGREELRGGGQKHVTQSAISVANPLLYHSTSYKDNQE